MGWGPRTYSYTYTQPYVIVPPTRRGLRFSPQEYRHIALAVGALIAAFTISFLSPLGGGPAAITLPGVAQVLLGATVAVVTGFLLHELAHKALAQRYGAWAEFRSSRTGLLFALATAVIGIVFAAPGAVYISGSLTREQNGRVSLVGPLTNFVVALAFTGAFFGAAGRMSGDVGFFVVGILFFAAYINAFLGVFNMLPIPPLDGSKVLAWNIAIWAIAIIGMGALLALYFLRIIF